jgi:protein O-GlcNAc transferase
MGRRPPDAALDFAPSRPSHRFMTIADEFERAFRLHQQGKLREAFLRYEAILKAEPEHAPALHYSGVVLMQSGKHAAAIERIRGSLKLDPGSADAWSNLAQALESVDRPEAALNALKQATELAPRSPEIWCNLAASELAQRRFAEAEVSARQALVADARHSQAWYHLALALDAQGRVLEALDATSRASAIAPAEAAPAGLKAQLHEGLGQLEQAREVLDAILVRQPTVAALQNQLASVADRQGDFATAARAYANALRLQPDNGATLSQLLFLRKRMGDWHDLGVLQDRFRKGVAAGGSLLTPFSFLSDPSTRGEQRACAAHWARSFPPGPRQRRRLLSAGRLRIGYLSSDFHDHPTSVLAAGIFEAHDRSIVEVLGYSAGPDDGSDRRARVVASFDRFFDARGATAADLADRIRADGIDVLVDLKGHTDGAPFEVLARRPAPIQVHWLGYPGTLGAPVVDYLIGDGVVTPLGEASDYSEMLVLLPGSYQSNDRTRADRAPPSRSELGLPEHAVVLCCFNATFKLNPAVVDAWARLLAVVPDAVLWLLSRDAEDPAEANLRRECAKRGIADHRIIFARHRPHADYLGLYRHADLFIDTWPYNAHTTASDALWMGCPVLTLRGETFAGRVGESLLRAVGLPELVAADVDAYVDDAIALARDPARRARLRAHLASAGRASVLFDAPTFARALEHAYSEMAAQYRSGRRAPIVILPPMR